VITGAAGDARLHCHKDDNIHRCWKQKRSSLRVNVLLQARTEVFIVTKTCVGQSPPWGSAAQLLKRFQEYYATRKFITLTTRLRHWSLSRDRWNHSARSYLISL
jgi:hypothetical protein